MGGCCVWFRADEGRPLGLSFALCAKPIAYFHFYGLLALTHLQARADAVLRQIAGMR